MSEICSICFDTKDYKSFVRCYDSKCDSIICSDCMDQFIESSTTVPKCVNDKCNKIYSLKQFENKEIKNLEKYNKLCLDYHLNENIEDIKNNIAQYDLIKKMREERNVFVKNSFPKAIQSVINMCMKDKLNKINKTNKKIVNDIVNSSGHFCMLSYCSGKLNDDFKCLKCETEFCKDCQKHKKTGHVCKESDLLSVNFMKTIGQCPNCKIHVEKSEGCRSMKCANCNTLFDYYTGAKADHGGQNSSIEVKETLKLSTLYRELYDPFLLRKIINYERDAPENNSEKILDRINKVLEEYIKKDRNSTPSYANKIAILFNEYIESKYNYVKYMQKIGEIEELHETGKLTNDSIDIVLEYF
jgi:hypothetical protein